VIFKNYLRISKIRDLKCDIRLFHL